MSDATPRSPSLTLVAPAKVNLFLHVTGRRDDGYHRIESLFALIDFADTVVLTPCAGGQIVRSNEVAGVPAEDDLAMRAARALHQGSGTREGVAIRVDKRIPLGAGLGGGSSDAATVLLGLNRLWNLAMTRSELASVALALGADVPFFVHGENAFVTGVGERVQPVSLRRQWLALAMPATHVSTAQIFASRALTRSTPSAKISVFSESYGRNDLQPVAVSKYPEVGRAMAALQRSGEARMTGSGAASIAVCQTEDGARMAVEALPAGITGRVVRTLTRHPLAAFAF